MTPYEEASNYLLTNLETVCSHLFPGGKRRSKLHSRLNCWPGWTLFLNCPGAANQARALQGFCQRGQRFAQPP